jgi:NAD(P)-dependent dehydrogenase (short-subunit alcohol dehydrogenase family)
LRFADKIVVVTGAASGIGYATAQLFADEGATLVLVDVDETGLEACAREIAERDSGTGIAVAADVSNSAAVVEVFSAVKKDFGKLDVLFNNAGIAEIGTVVTTSEEVWDRIIDVNLKSVYLCCREGIPLMTDGGAIINTASSWGPIAANNVAAYCASKAGVINLTRSIAIDFAHRGIRANCLVPGTTDTRMVQSLLSQQPDPEAATRFYEHMQPIHRFASPTEIGRAVLFLASGEASYATGAVFAIDGGYGAGRVAFEHQERS